MKEMNIVLERALLIATLAHIGQVDKNGMPYILHPLAVASKLDTLELKVIGLLHDTIEDTNITAEYLVNAGIPKELVSAVELLTKPKNEDYFDYVRRVKENPMAKQVKLADLSHNTDENRGNGLDEAHRKKYEKAKQILEG